MERLAFGSRPGQNVAVARGSMTGWREIEARRRLLLIAGPCVLEDEALCLKIGRTLRQACQRAGARYVFKASYDKANRTSGQSFRGPGLEEGLAQLARIRKALGVPVLTDVHTEAEARAAYEEAFPERVQERAEFLDNLEPLPGLFDDADQASDDDDDDTDQWSDDDTDE